jgi:hypothetical protein
MKTRMGCQIGYDAVFFILTVSAKLVSSTDSMRWNVKLFAPTRTVDPVCDPVTAALITAEKLITFTVAEVGVRHTFHGGFRRTVTWRTAEAVSCGVLIAELPST